MYRQRTRYWTNSKFSKYMRNLVGVDSPEFFVWEKNENGDYFPTQWELDYKKSHPYMHFFTEEVLDFIQDVFYFPYDVYYNTSKVIRNRFIQHNYRLDSNLNKNNWHDYRERMLHAVFDSYVESYCIQEKGRGSLKELYEHWAWEQELDEPKSQRESAFVEQELFEWWTKERPADWEKLEEVTDDTFLDEEGRLELKDSEMLKKLIDIRLGLWT